MKNNAFIRLVLAIALVSALWHVSQHSLDVSDNEQADCQVCRLSHIPAADLPAVSPLLLPHSVLAVEQAPVTRPVSRDSFDFWLARGPPLNA